MRSVRAAVWLLVLLGWGAGALAAKDAAKPAPDLLTQAQVKLDEANLALDTTERFRLADEAAALCEQAAVQRPKDPEPILRLVRALTIADAAHPETCRPRLCERALTELQRLRKVDPMAVESARVASEEAIIYSRLRRFEDALVAYDRALPLVDAERRPNDLDERYGAVLLWGNSAETAMALGRLDDAIRRYELARDHAPYGETEWQLSLYGLGVALDRDGQVERARRVLEQALEHDPSLARLHDDGVFFEPPGDLFYYEGLAHEVAGDDADARIAFERYLAEVPRAAYAGRARAHLASLARRPSAQAPTISIEVGPPMMVKGLRSGEAIRARVAEHHRELSLCYERALREHPGLRVRVQLAMEMPPHGFVGQRVHVLATSEPAQSLSRCIELSAGRWRFPPVRGTEADTVLVPIDFSPGRR